MTVNQKEMHGKINVVPSEIRSSKLKKHNAMRINYLPAKESLQCTESEE